MRLPDTPPPVSVLMTRAQKRGRFDALVRQSISAGPTVGGRYRHWDTLRRLDPPDGLTPDEWWLAVKMARGAARREIPPVDRTGRPFAFTLPDPVLRMARRIDTDLGGQIALPEDSASPEQRDRFLFNSLAEEAITSSQLEGAATTRAVAKEMLRSNRAPRDEGEAMILGNYRAMQRIRRVANEPLTPALVAEIQAIVTAGTLAPDRQGLRQPGVAEHEIAVFDNQTQALLHQPPDARELPARLDALCAFANATDDDGPFVPPVVRAILLHFWLAYDHPFVDGNGRTARALFYWSMLRQGFWLAEYLSISHIIRQGPARYARAFLYTETDENDLTYFVLHQLDVIVRATEAVKAYVRRKGREVREVQALLRPSAGLNHRQVALVSGALKHPGQVYTVRSHETEHGVSTLTARKDLVGLADRGLLASRRLERQGRALAFTAPPDLGDRLRALEA